MRYTSIQINVWSLDIEITRYAFDLTYHEIKNCRVKLIFFFVLKCIYESFHTVLTSSEEYRENAPLSGVASMFVVCQNKLACQCVCVWSNAHNIKH